MLFELVVILETMATMDHQTLRTYAPMVMARDLSLDECATVRDRSRDWKQSDLDRRTQIGWHIVAHIECWPQTD